MGCVATICNRLLSIFFLPFLSIIFSTLIFISFLPFLCILIILKFKNSYSRDLRNGESVYFFRIIIVSIFNFEFKSYQRH